MSDYTKLFERAGARYEAPSLSTEGLLLRRDRKRRNKRITAAVVGIALFVAVVWLVKDVASLNRTTVVPGGPSTGPSVTGPAIGATGDPFSVGFEGLPPERATSMEPSSAEPIMSDGGIHPWYEVHLYADGRLIWARGEWEDIRLAPGMPLSGHCCHVSAWIEQRLTPEAVELVRSGAVELGGQFENPGEQLPGSAWEDPELKPYAPSRYAICSWSPPFAVTSMVPSSAQVLLRGARHLENLCVEVTIEEARSLAAILTDAGFEEGPGPTGTVFFGKQDDLLAFDPILPDGGFVDGVGG